MNDILAKIKRTTLISLAFVAVSLVCALLIYMGLSGMDRIDIPHDLQWSWRILWVAFFIQSFLQLALLGAVLLLLYHNGRARRRL